MITNPGFEAWTGGVPDNWVQEGSVTLTQEEDVVHSGTYSVGLTTTSSSNAGVYQDVNVTPGEDYEYKVWINAPQTGSGVGVGIGISWYDSLDGYISWLGTEYNTLIDTWEEVSVTGTAPGNAMYARCRIRGYTNTAFAGYADDAFLDVAAIVPDTVTIYDIQYTTDPSGDSPYDGQPVVTTGIVTAICGSRFWIQDLPATAWNGILVYGYTYAGAVGDEVEVTGIVDEYFGMTEIVSVSSVVLLGTGYAVGPGVVTTNQVATMEDYEGVLVQVLYAICTNPDLGYGEWEVDDGSGPCVVNDLCYPYLPTMGYAYDVTGVVEYSYGAFKINPRDDCDICEYPIDVQENDLRTPFSLTVAPNITSGAFDVRFSLPERAIGEISLYDISGRTVATFVRGDISEGLHNYSFNGNLESGVYFVKADFTDHSIMRTVIVTN
jgi:hypothetical protein